MMRRFLVLLLALSALCAPAMALSLTVDTTIPTFVLDNGFTLTGSTSPTLASWVDTSTSDFLPGKTSYTTVTDGSVVLSPTLNFTILNNGEPVFRPGTGTEWDLYLLNKDVVRVQGVYYMYYAASASASSPGSIGLATSDNGIAWERYSANPVLGSGVDSYDKSGLDWPVVLKDGSTWHMWYSGAVSSTDVSVCHATSTDGYNWTKGSSNPVLANGPGASDWDGYEVRPCSVMKIDGNYTMYYRALGSGGVHYLGLAVSTDGTTWTESSSNPLYRGETSGWNKGTYDFTTLEVFSGSLRLHGYGGTPSHSLGYATSTDGTTWKDSGQAVFVGRDGTIFSEDMMYNDYVDVGEHYYMNMLCLNSTDRTYGAFQVDREGMMGSFVSRQYDAGGICRLNDVRFTLDVPAGGSTALFVRWYNVSTEPGEWFSYASSFNHSGVKGKYFQYMVAFTAYRDWFRLRLLDATFDYTVPVESVAVRVGNGNWIPANGTPALWSINLNLTDGDYDIYVCATDAIGKQAIRTLPFRVDFYRPTGNITLEGGADATNSTTIRYATAAADTHGVVEMQVSLDPLFTGAPWAPFATSGSVPWSDADGAATVYVRYKDGAGRESLTFSDTITVDTTAPTGSVSIAEGAQYTNSRDVRLSISYADLTGVASMRVTNRPALAGAKWRDPETSIDWTLNDSDGRQTVYVQLQDALGWVTTITDDIVVDRAAPELGMTIDGGVDYTTDRDVRLVVDIDDASPVMARLWNSEQGEQSDLTEFANHTELDWRLSEGEDGSRTVELYAVDAAGNVARTKASILLDTTPPTVAVLLDGGARYTRGTIVAVAVTASDATSGVGGMRRSASPDLSAVPWGPFEGALEWTVLAPDGEKRLYVEVSDRAGLTTVAEAAIVLDTTPPTGSVSIEGGAEFASTQVVTLRFDLVDAFELGGVRAGGSPDLSTAEWSDYATTIPWDLGTQEGARTVWAEVRDAAGNVWSGSDSVVLDLTSPELSVTIEDGAEHTLSLAVSFTWSGSDTNGLVDVAFDTSPDFSGAEVAALDGGASAGPSTRALTFTGSSGLKVVYVRLKDSSGRTTVASDDIWYSSSRPTGNLTLGTGSGWTRITRIEARVAATDGSPTSVRLASTEAGLEAAPWQALKVTPYAFDLTSGDGPKTVWMQLLAPHNITSLPVNRTIVLDTSGPTVTAAKAPPKTTSSSSVKLELVVDDAYDQAPKGLWRVNGGQWSTLPAGPITVKLKEGTNTIEVEAKDAAGNSATQTWTIKREGGGLPGGWGLLVGPVMAIAGAAMAARRRRAA